jgi:hypothetical protein
MKETKDLFNENYKSLKREIKENLEDGKITQTQHCENGYTTKSHLHIHCNLHQNSNDILHRDKKNKS